MMTQINNYPDECNFKKMFNEFKCPICFEVVMKATLTTCSHLFCEFCIKNAHQESSKCPICLQFCAISNPLPMIDKTISALFSAQDYDVQVERSTFIQERKDAMEEFYKRRAFEVMHRNNCSSVLMEEIHRTRYLMAREVYYMEETVATIDNIASSISNLRHLLDE